MSGRFSEHDRKLWQSDIQFDAEAQRSEAAYDALYSSKKELSRSVGETVKDYYKEIISPRKNASLFIGSTKAIEPFHFSKKGAIYTDYWSINRSDEPNIHKKPQVIVPSDQIMTYIDDAGYLATFRLQFESPWDDASRTRLKELTSGLRINFWTLKDHSHDLNLNSLAAIENANIPGLTIGNYSSHHSTVYKVDVPLAGVDSDQAEKITETLAPLITPFILERP